MIRVASTGHSAAQYSDTIPNTPDPSDKEREGNKLKESDDNEIAAYSSKASVEHGPCSRYYDIQDQHEDSHREVGWVRWSAAHIC